MIRPTTARINLGALKSNYRHIVDYISAEPRPRTPGVIAVVKANAYGHGAAQVARALEDAGADLIACADIEEGTALRAAGVRAEILVFGALSVSDLDGLFRSEEHTSELQSQSNLVCRLLLEKKKKSDDQHFPCHTVSAVC